MTTPAPAPNSTPSATATRVATTATTTKAPRKPRATKAKKPVDPARAQVDRVVHETDETLATITLTPPHPPREETPEYAAAHKFLVYTKRACCEVCGVNIDTLGDPEANPFGAKALETHHFPIERSLADACDPVKVHRDYPQVYDRRTLMLFVDSPANLKVLCDVHHRSLERGIHHLTHADWTVQKYLYDGYEIAALAKDAAAALAQDEAIVRAKGIEQDVQSGAEATLEAQALTAPTSAPVPASPTAKKPRKKAGVPTPIVAATRSALPATRPA